VDVLAGEIPEAVAVREGPVEYAVDLRHGQKTGLFLDQRENREAAARYARGRLLDCFSYHGGFAMRLAPQCESAEALDISADAVAALPSCRAQRRGGGARGQRLRRAAATGARGQPLRHHRARPAGLRQEQGVVPAPPPAQGHQPARPAAAGAKRPLVTCSCSYNITEEMFGAILHEGRSRRVLVTVVERMQGATTVLLGVPETYYLKCFILRRVE
jgi:23S rRNA (cytosine1962-C5)-methyltransferase